jgi:hypothetical protein
VQYFEEIGGLIIKGRKPGLFVKFWLISMLLDPDPHSNTDPHPGPPNECGYSGPGSTTLKKTETVLLSLQ